MSKDRKTTPDYFEITIAICDNCKFECDEELLSAYGLSLFCEDCRIEINKLILELEKKAKLLIDKKALTMNRNNAKQAFQEWITSEVAKHENNVLNYDSMNLEQIKIAINIIDEFLVKISKS